MKNLPSTTDSSGSGAAEKLKADYQVLLMETTKLCKDLINGQKKFISSLTDNNWRASTNSQTSLQNRVETLEQIVLNLVKRLEIQDQLLWKPSSEYASQDSRVEEKSSQSSLSEDMEIEKREPERVPDNDTTNIMAEPKPNVVYYQGLNENKSTFLRPNSAAVEFFPLRPVTPVVEERPALAPLISPNKAAVRMVKPGAGKTNNSESEKNNLPTILSFPRLLEAVERAFNSLTQDLPSVLKEISTLAGNLTPDDIKKVMERILQEALKSPQSVETGGQICQILQQVIPTYRNQLIEFCQREFVTLTTIQKNPHLEKRAVGFLWLMTQLYLKIRIANSKRIPTFQLAVVELMRTLLSLKSSSDQKDNFKSVRDMLQILKPSFVEEPDPSLRLELAKLSDSLDELKASGDMGAAIKKNFMLLQSTVRNLIMAITDDLPFLPTEEFQS